MSTLGGADVGGADALAAALVDNAPVDPRLEPVLREALATAVALPGKRLRGRLVLTVADALAGPSADALALATAVEYYHLASLLLDDLPCMDDAQVRRGQPCLHRRYGEATAILAALAFINRAYALVGFATAGSPPWVRLRVQALLDACLGTAGLLGGQARDLRPVPTVQAARAVGRVATGKTAALLWLSLLLPALAFGAPERTQRALRRLGLYWGLLFQALDDLRDLLATTVDAGKNTGRDRALQRPNLALVLGVPAARNRVQRLLRQADAQLAALTAQEPRWRLLASCQQELEQAAARLLPGSRALAA